MSANLIANSVKETTATTGTSPLVLTGAVAGHTTFAAYAAGAEKDLYYRLDWAGGYEIGFGHLNASGTLTRQRVTESSAHGVNLSGLTSHLASLPAGEKTVSLVAPGCSMVSVFPDTDDFDSAGLPLSPPSATDQRATALGIRAVAGLDAVAIGHAAEASLPGAKQIGQGIAMADWAIQHFRENDNVDMWSIDHLAGVTIGSGVTDTMETVNVAPIEGFVGQIDLVIRRPWTTEIYYARISVSVSSSLSSTLTVIHNTLGFTPTVVVELSSYDSPRAGANYINVVVTNGGANNVHAACKTAGVLIKS